MTCSRRLRRTWGPSTRGPRASAKPASLRMTGVVVIRRIIFSVLRCHFSKCRQPWLYASALRRRVTPLTPVILSGVTASRSEAVTESKDPVPACSGTGTARHSHHACTKHGEDALTCPRRLRRTWGPSTRGPRASAKLTSLRMTDVGAFSALRAMFLLHHFPKYVSGQGAEFSSRLLKLALRNPFRNPQRTPVSTAPTG